MKDFQTHNTDATGRKMFVKGDDAEPQGNEIYKLTRPRVDTFRPDGTLDLKIEAAEAFYHMRSNSIWSARELSVRAGDQRMAIKGAGFAWDPVASSLAISNQVEALLRRDAVATNRTDQASEAAATATNVIRVTSDRFTHRPELVVFDGNVRVKEADGTVRCERLNVYFDERNEIRRIDALGGVFLTQGTTEAEGQRAEFEVKRGILRLYERTKWRQEDRRGESEVLILDRPKNTLRAETRVRMLLPSSLVATNSDAAPKEPRTKEAEVEIMAETFDYAPTNSVTGGGIAIFNGHVRANDPQAKLACELLTIFFDPTNRLTRAVADREVVITSEEAEAHGTRAVFENDEIAISGPPKWKAEGRSGSSELLVLNTKTGEIRALSNVVMRIPAASLPLSILAPATNTASAPRTNEATEILVTANFFQRQTNRAIFTGGVRALEERGQIDANEIVLSFAASNRVERIVAKGDVILTQEETQAIGQVADYDLVAQKVRLTGNPKAWTEGREIDAREFWLDRITGKLTAMPPYKVRLRRSPKDAGMR